ncbi:MAG TPA: hypothetical protein GXX75_04115 [Clostridiales bacterium]|nr:hypothetical protein [Clostridiales bacterium]
MTATRLSSSITSKIHKFSLIQADYLLQNECQGDTVYLFLTQRDNSSVQVCRSLFPKREMNYAEGQTRYTLLRKEKIDTRTGSVEIQYDRLTPKKRTPK